MPFGSHEANVLRNYLDICMELPWNVESKLNIDINRARKILDAVGEPDLLPPLPSPPPPCAASFTWPTLEVLKQQNLNLREFLDIIEAKLLDEALEAAAGVRNQAAEILGIKRTTLIEKLKKRGLKAD